MAGLDDIDIQVEAEVSMRVSQVVNSLLNSATGADNVNTLNAQGVLYHAMHSRPEPFSNYDPMYPLLTHISVFPHGKGVRPQGMSEESYVRALLRRSPRSQYINRIVIGK